MSTLLRWLTWIGQGIGIGVANVIPGVSGGTMALIFGIYERLIGLLSDLVRAGLKLLRLDLVGFWNDVRDLDLPFLFWLAVGVVMAPILGAAFIPGALETWPEESRSLFFGLILGTLPIPWLRIKHHGIRNAAILLIAAAISFLLVGIPPLDPGQPGLIAIFLSAALAICAMILPGVSGAFILLILGMYAPIFEAIDARDPAVVGTFMLGAGIGLGSFAVFLKWLLERAHDMTMAALVGLMAGSLRSLWPWLAEDRSMLLPESTEGLSWILILGLGGLVISVFMTVLEIRRKARG
jgi:putative membrane protein